MTQQLCTDWEEKGGKDANGKKVKRKQAKLRTRKSLSGPGKRKAGGSDDDDDFFGNLLGQKSAAAFQVMTPDSTGARVASNSTGARVATDVRVKDTVAPKKASAIKEETVFEQDEEWNW